MEPKQATRWRVLEVHNFGGFFGGDTVTLTVEDLSTHAEETITIDEKALANIDDRYKVTPTMVFELQMSGTRVDRAELIAADDWHAIQAALNPAPPSAPLAGPQIRAYRCGGCKLWILGTPSIAAGLKQCCLCSRPL